MTRNTSVITTDEKGSPLGTEEIIKAHTNEGTLHKAFSVCIFNEEKTKILIQKRNPNKMLFGGLWANTCCSHPQPDCEITKEGERRLKEELGFTCPLQEAASFVYKARDSRGRGIEWEHDTVLIGNISKDTLIDPDPEEVAQWKWINVEELMEDMEQNPKKYAPWFKEVLEISRTRIPNPNPN
jgi:isopentenyl-diphosphate delta-isomerase type 1